MELTDEIQAVVPAPENSPKRSRLAPHIADPGEMESDPTQQDELQRSKLRHIPTRFDDSFAASCGI